MAQGTWASWVLVLGAVLVGCGGSSRDAHAVAEDLEGTVSQSSLDRVLRDVDLAHVPFVLSVGSLPEQRFGADDQGALEEALRGAEQSLEGTRVEVTQESLDEGTPQAPRLTLTLAVHDDAGTRYVPVALDLARDGRRLVVSRARVMVATTGDAPP